MNQVIQTIKTRRSVRAYKQDPVPVEYESGYSDNKDKAQCARI